MKKEEGLSPNLTPNKEKVPLNTKKDKLLGTSDSVIRSPVSCLFVGQISSISIPSWLMTSETYTIFIKNGWKFTDKSFF